MFSTESPTTTPEATVPTTCTCTESYCTGYCPAGTREHYAQIYGDPAMTTAETLDRAGIPHHLPRDTDERTSA